LQAGGSVLPGLARTVEGARPVGGPAWFEHGQREEVGAVKETTTTARASPPIWLIDVDGVINARRPSWGTAPHRGNVCAEGEFWRMQWAPALILRIRRLIAAGSVEARWCTTWCDHAAELERLFGLPVLERAFAGRVTGAEAAPLKVAAARGVLAEGRRLVWTDDEVVPASGPLRDELTRDGRALLIAPMERRGLQPPDLDAIDEFCGHVSTGPGDADAS
jgi:hypothetical protein